MPKVSVIVAVYNVEPYLRRSLDCLVNQTMSDLEFICVDDCSTDNSLSILREYAEKDKRFKIISSEANSGAAVARNKGLDVASGEYLGFIDPDDTIDLNYYESLYDKAKKTNADIVKCERKDIFSDGRICVSKLNKSIKKSKYKFTYEWTTAIYRASIIFDNNIRFPEECTKAQDVVFLNRVILKVKTLELIYGVFYYYHRRENSLNSGKIPLKSIESACRAKILMAEDLNNSGLFKSNLKAYVDKYKRILRVVFYTLFQNDTKDARECCVKNFIELYDMCLAKNKLCKKFYYPIFIKYAKTKNFSDLANIFIKLKSRDELREDYFISKFNFLEKIFSIKNSYDNIHKILIIFGVKYKFIKKK